MNFSTGTDSHNGLRSAFTLAELLVVIGVVAVLLALLMPALSYARASARTTVCASQQRQLLAAHVLQAQDHHGFAQLAGVVDVGNGLAGYGSLPAALHDSRRSRYAYVRLEARTSMPTLETLAPYPATLLPYLGAQNVRLDEGYLNGVDGPVSQEHAVTLLQCPSVEATASANLPSVEVRIDDVAYLRGWAVRFDYALNAGLLGYHHESRYEPRRLRGNLARVADSAQVVLLGDAWSRTPRGNTFTWTPSLDGTVRTTLANVADGSDLAFGPTLDAERHSGQGNFGFVDGHSETRSITADALRDVVLANELR